MSSIFSAVILTLFQYSFHSIHVNRQKSEIVSYHNEISTIINDLHHKCTKKLCNKLYFILSNYKTFRQGYAQFKLDVPPLYHNRDCSGMFVSGFLHCDVILILYPVKRVTYYYKDWKLPYSIGTIFLAFCITYTSRHSSMTGSMTNIRYPSTTILPTMMTREPCHE